MLFTPNIGSAFISVERECSAAKANQAKGLATMAQLNQCVNNASENKQAARRTLLLIGGVAAVGAYFMFFRKK